MRRSVVVGLLAALVLMMGSYVRANAGGLDITPAVLTAVIGQPAAGGAAAPPAVQPRQRPPGPPALGMPGPGMMGPMEGMGLADASGVLEVAATSAAVKDNAEVQKLVDKLIAAEKASLQSQQAHIAAMEQLVQACRAGDQNAIKTARDALQAARRKMQQDRMQAMGDTRALYGKLQEARAFGMERQLPPGEPGMTPPMQRQRPPVAPAAPPPK